MANGLNLDPEVFDSALRKRGLGLGSTEGIDLSDRALQDLPEEKSEEKDLNFVQYWFEHRSPKVARNRALRAQTKRADRKARGVELQRRFKIASDMATEASKLKGEKLKEFYESALPDIEEFFPGISDTIKALAKDPVRLKKSIDDFAKNPSKQRLHDAAFEVDPSGETNVELMKLDERRAAKKKPEPFADVPIRIEKQSRTLGERIGLSGESLEAFKGELSRKTAEKMRDPENPLGPNEAMKQAFKEITDSGRLKISKDDPISIFKFDIPFTGGSETIFTPELGDIPELDLGDTPAARGKEQVIEQTLPKGIPKGSTLIGTSGGKPVYETPKGKQLIVK